MLSVRDLEIDFWVDGTWYPAVVGANFDLNRGEVLAIVGESGSGKSTTAMSLLGLLPKNSHVRGSIELGGRQLVGADARELRSIRGREVSVIFQEPMTALNPVYTIGFQIGEMLRSHNAMSPKAARARAIELLKLVEIPDPERRIDSYPHQLSGGQRQRAMIAQSLACDPELLIADEPTTALDVTVQAEILKLMRDLKHRIDAAIVLITHDMGVVADMADRVLVMKDGKHRRVRHRRRGLQPADRSVHDAAAQCGPAPRFGHQRRRAGDDGRLDDGRRRSGRDRDRHIGRPRPAAPTEPDSMHRAGIEDGVEPIVDLVDIAIEYPKRGRTPAFRAVEGLTLQIGRGEVMGLVGESGSGKTTIGRALVGLLPIVEGTASVVGSNLVGVKPEGAAQPFGMTSASCSRIRDPR